MGVVFADDIVRALLVVCRQVSVGEEVVGQVLVAGDSSTLGNCEREAWPPAQMDLVGSQTHGGTDRIDVRKFDFEGAVHPFV